MPRPAHNGLAQTDRRQHEDAEHHASDHADIFALPSWLPFANVFSIGDVLIGLGIVAAIVIAMRRPAGAELNPA